MACFRDSGYTRAFRALFERLPPYTLHNMRASRENEMQRIDAARQAGFAQRTEPGVPAHQRLAVNPAMDGLTPHPEAGSGRVVNSFA